MGGLLTTREKRKDYGRGAAIKVADSLQDPMCIAPAVRKEDTRAFVARQLQA
jgi:hypothetical protein